MSVKVRIEARRAKFSKKMKTGMNIWRKNKNIISKRGEEGADQTFGPVMRD